MRSLRDTYMLYVRTLEFIKPGDSPVAVFLGVCTALLLLTGLGFAISETLVPKMAGWPPGGDGDGAWNHHPGEYVLIIMGEGCKIMITVGLFPGLFWTATWILCRIGQVIIVSYCGTTAWMFSGEPPEPRRPLSPGSAIITIPVHQSSADEGRGGSCTPGSQEAAERVITIDRDSHQSYILYHRRRSQGWPESYSANRRASVSTNVTTPSQAEDTLDDSGSSENNSSGPISLQHLHRDGDSGLSDKGAEAPAQ